MKAIWKFFRQLYAWYRVSKLPEECGYLHDYANGRWKRLSFFQDDPGQDEAKEIARNMLENPKDDIYVATIISKYADRYDELARALAIPNPNKAGYFIVFDSWDRVWSYHFFPGVYSLNEAFSDVKVKCRQIADQMGYRRLDEQQAA